MNTAASPSRKVLLIGWNLASWQLLNPLLDQGKLPHLQALVEQGMMGNLKTQRPLLEHVVYNSVATGAYADQHGVLGPLEIGPQNQIQPTGSFSRRADAMWDILSDQYRRCHVVNFPTTGPAEKINGTFISPSFFETVPGTYQEKFEVPLVSVYPESQLEELSQFIVTLQDIDSEVMSMFVPRFRELDAADPKLIHIGTAAAQTFSIHATATHLMEQYPWDFVSVSYDLIELLGRGFFQYHVPATTTMSTLEQENRYRIAVHLFSEVVNAAAMLCDRLLGRLIELAGEETTVILHSPWGILNQNDFVAIDEEEGSDYLESVYRGEGIFVMRETDMPRDELLHEISFLDICPTVLRSSGIDAGDQLAGSAVQDYTEHHLAPKKSSHPKNEEEDEAAVANRLQRGQSLSFSDPFSEKPLRDVEKGNLWTLAAVQLASDRREETLPLLLRLYHANPLETARGYMVAETLYRTGYLKEAVALMQPLSIVYADHAVGQFMAGFVALNHGSLEQAKEMFEAAEANNPPFPILFYYLGQVYLLLDLPERAEKAFSRFLELDPCLPLAYLGLSESYLRSKRFEEAAESALDAVGANFAEPAMHIALGRAMAQLGENARAKEAYETAIRISPNHKLAHDHLEWLEQYSNEAIRDSTKHTWRSLTPPLHPQMGGVSRNVEKIKGCIEQINRERNNYLDALENLDSNLEQELVTKGVQVALDSKDAESNSQNLHSLKDASDSGWVIRPAEPLDQASIFRMSFDSPFTDVSEKEIFVAHPVGTRNLAGAVMIQWSSDQPLDLRLRFSIREEDEEEFAKEISSEQIQMWLLRAAIGRAIAGKAKQVKFTFRSEQQSVSLHERLLDFGFTDFKTQEIYQIDPKKTLEICVKMLDRYRQRKKIPADVRLTTLSEISIDDADKFLSRYFAKGVGDVPGQVHHPDCPVLFKGDQIIGCAVGYDRNSTTFVTTRIAVLPEYRRGWGTLMMFFAGSRVSSGLGHSSLEFVIDEEQYADWVKIAKRHFDAQQTDTMRTMLLHFDNS
ncbi:MAG: alkaline phosphatase family protein [Planctomycetota bacterium]|nr:alkaline phosphatase family protein [Planctomycetota bacterium]